MQKYLRILLLSSFLLSFFIFRSNEASAATGTVIEVNPDGISGRIEMDSPLSFSYAGMTKGTQSAIPFYDKNLAKTELSVGDRVSFEVGQSKGWGIAKRISPLRSIEIKSNFLGNLTVESNELLIISNGAVVSGDIKLDGGSLAITSGSRLDGRIKGKKRGTPSLFVLESEVERKIKMDRFDQVQILGSTLRKEINVKNGRKVLFRASTLLAPVIVERDFTTEISDNAIVGKLLLKDIHSVVMESNWVVRDAALGRVRSGVVRNNKFGDKLDADNCGTIEISDNSIELDNALHGLFAGLVHHNSIGGNLMVQEVNSIDITENNIKLNNIVDRILSGSITQNTIGGKLIVKEANKVVASHNIATKGIKADFNGKVSLYYNTTAGTIRVNNTDVLSENGNQERTDAAAPVMESTKRPQLAKDTHSPVIEAYAPVTAAEVAPSALNIWPNPMMQEGTIAAIVPDKVKGAEIGIYDASGKLIKRLPLEKGENELKIDADNFHPGLYFFVLHSPEGFMESRQILIGVTK